MKCTCEPRWPDWPHHEDCDSSPKSILAPIRGIVLALILSVAAWAVILGVLGVLR